MQSNLITQKLLTHHPKMLKYMLFLSDDMVKLLPSNFHELTSQERYAKLIDFKTYAQVPTKDNHWVWCGVTFRGYPRYANKPVLKPLFETFHEVPIYQSRLKQAPGRYPSCVNPFHYYSNTVNRGCRSEYDQKAAKLRSRLAEAEVFAKTNALLPNSGFDKTKFIAELVQAGFPVDIGTTVFNKLIKDLKNGK